MSNLGFKSIAKYVSLIHSFKFFSILATSCIQFFNNTRICTSLNICNGHMSLHREISKASHSYTLLNACLYWPRVDSRFYNFTWKICIIIVYVMVRIRSCLLQNVMTRYPFSLMWCFTNRAPGMNYSWIYTLLSLLPTTHKCIILYRLNDIQTIYHILYVCTHTHLIATLIPGHFFTSYLTLILFLLLCSLAL